MSTKYTIEQLSELTGFPIRTIRFYIQQGMIPASAGRGLGAGYDDAHLEPLLEIRRLQTAGIQLSAIRTRLANPAICREVECFAAEESAPALAAAESATAGEACRRIRLADGCEMLVSERFYRLHQHRLAMLAGIIDQWEKENRDE
jgi:DNA-binding transcriptional MerR regulator